MPKASVTQGGLIVERIRTALGALQICVGDPLVKLSASFGMTAYCLEENASATLNRAEATSLTGKRTGTTAVHSLLSS
jgi:hypothetical protein